MIGVALGDDMRFLAVASPEYLKKSPPLNVPDDLQFHRCIRQRLPSGKRYNWEFMKQAHEISVNVPGALTLDSNQLMVQSAVACLGIAYVPDLYAAPFIKKGELVAVLEDWCPIIPGLMLYFPANKRMPPGLRVLVDLIKEMRLSKS